MSIYIIDNYDSFTYNIVQQMMQIYGNDIETIFNDELSFDELKRKKPKGIIISPGPGHPANQKDFGICSQIIKRRDELNCPILGICLGHQGIAFNFGGSIQHADRVVHGKSSLLNQTTPSRMFEGLPENFEAIRYHSLIVDKNSLPKELKITAIDQNTEQIMAIEHKSEPLFGLQFHPESIGTLYGEKIMRNFSSLCN